VSLGCEEGHFVEMRNLTLFTSHPRLTRSDGLQSASAHAHGEDLREGRKNGKKFFRQKASPLVMFNPLS
jgi:hypothetical protein